MMELDKLIDQFDKLLNTHKHPDNFYSLTGIKDNKIPLDGRIESILEFLIKNYNEGDYNNMIKWTDILREEITRAQNE